MLPLTAGMPAQEGSTGQRSRDLESEGVQNGSNDWVCLDGLTTGAEAISPVGLLCPNMQAEESQTQRKRKERMIKEEQRAIILKLKAARKEGNAEEKAEIMRKLKAAHEADRPKFLQSMKEQRRRIKANE